LLLGNREDLGSTPKAELSPGSPPVRPAVVWLHQNFSSACCSGWSGLLKFTSKAESLLSSLRMHRAQCLGNRRRKTFPSVS